MSLSGILGVLLVVVVIFLVIKTILGSIRLFFFILLTALFLVFFFNISFSEVTAWLSAQDRLQWLVSTLVNTLLFSFTG